MKLLKQINMFFIKENFLKNTPNPKEGFNGLSSIVIFKLDKARNFYFPDFFARKLSYVLGKKISESSIRHYQFTDTSNPDLKFFAWAYWDGTYVYFAQVGRGEIFLSIDSLYLPISHSYGEIEIRNFVNLVKTHKLFLRYDIVTNKSCQKIQLLSLSFEDGSNHIRTPLDSSKSEYISHILRNDDSRYISNLLDTSGKWLRNICHNA